MTKKDLAFWGGLATIIAAVTAASRKRQWQEVHTAALVVGGVVTILGWAAQP
jgi:hypothetical protein